MNKQLANKKSNTLATFIQNQKKQIEAALPKHMSPDRMLRISLTELRKTPQLMSCSPVSVIASIIQCAQLGIEPGNNLGHAYLIPWKNNKSGQLECQFMLGYRGMIELALRSEKVKYIFATIVYESEEFDLEFGTSQHLKHKPAPPSERGKIIGAYALAKLDNGETQIEFLFKEEIDKIRDLNSKSKNSQTSPWKASYEEMCKKTAVRRLFKYLPVSSEAQQAVSFDDQAEKEPQDYGMIIDCEPETSSNEVNSVEYINADSDIEQSKSDQLAQEL